MRLRHYDDRQVSWLGDRDQPRSTIAEEFLRRAIGGMTNQRERRSRLSAADAQGMDISGLQY
jgi:hypothetical protein